MYEELLRHLEMKYIPYENWVDFIRTYVMTIEIRPLLSYGSVRFTRQADLFHRDAGNVIILYVFSFIYGQQEVNATIYHEITHIWLRTVGHKGEIDDALEQRIEKLGIVLARRYPWIPKVLTEVFPGFRFEKEFFEQGFRKPIILSQAP